MIPFILSLYNLLFNNGHINSSLEGRLGGSVRWASDFGSGHDLVVDKFEPRPASGSVLRAQSLEPVSDSVCLSVCLSLSAPPRSCSVSLCLKQTNKQTKTKNKNQKTIAWKVLKFNGWLLKAGSEQL